MTEKKIAYFGLLVPGSETAACLENIFNDI
jgi:hypothetical protein